MISVCGSVIHIKRLFLLSGARVRTLAFQGAGTGDDWPERLPQVGLLQPGLVSKGYLLVNIQKTMVSMENTLQ